MVPRRPNIMTMFLRRVRRMPSMDLYHGNVHFRRDIGLTEREARRCFTDYL